MKLKKIIKWAGIAILVVLFAIPFAFFRNTGHSLQTPFTNKPPVVFHEPKHVAATADARRAAEQTMGGFVKTAIIRVHPGLAWDLATWLRRVPDERIAATVRRRHGSEALESATVLRGLQEEVWRVLHDARIEGRLTRVGC